MTPESCADCVCFRRDAFPCTAFTVYFCELADQTIPDEDRERPEWCPLEERDGSHPIFKEDAI